MVTWWESALLFLTAAMLIFAPGILVAVALRMPWTTTLAVAPVVSIAIIALTAVAADKVSVRWGLAPVLFATLLAAGVAALVAHGLRTHGRMEPKGTDQPGAQRAGVRDIAPTWLWWTASCTGAIALMIYHIKVLLGSPESFSQTFDAIFHLNAVRWIVEHGNGSSLTMAMTSGDAAPSFYPLAWHDLASLVMMTTGTSSPAAATNAVIMAVAALVWVAGCMYLAATVMEGRPSAIVAAGFFTVPSPPSPIGHSPLGFSTRTSWVSHCLRDSWHS